MKLLLFILACAILFSALDVSVIYFTRFHNRALLDWMHNHEKPYAFVTRSVEALICAPALALKPIVSHWLIKLITTEEQEKSITHAPPPSLAGFYAIRDRAEGYFFVPWYLWGLWWLLWSLVWYVLIVRRYGNVFVG